jgi:hypothetical protein
MIVFSDSRKWGSYSYLDLLERNNVLFKYDGKHLSFPNKEAEQKAGRIWHSLTGQSKIGIIA